MCIYYINAMPLHIGDLNSCRSGTHEAPRPKVSIKSVDGSIAVCHSLSYISTSFISLGTVLNVCILKVIISF